MTATNQTSTRWIQLAIGIVCMIMIANLQYGWTLFVEPIHKAHGWSLTNIQWAFSLFVALETWLSPLEGWIVDILGPNRGPKAMVLVGGVLIAIAWLINGYAESLSALYVGAAIGGVGAGAVYATCVGNAVKWFADRRGLAVGLTAAGFGAGAALTVVPIRAVIASHGYQSAFIWFGLLQGIVVFALGWLLRGPQSGEVVRTAPVRVEQSARSYEPIEVVQSPVFWVLYVMFVLVSASGLMATAQIALIARDFGVADTVAAFGATTLTVALLVDSVANGFARPLFGWISDQIGREYTMALAFGLGAASYWLLGAAGASPWAFIVFAGLIFLARQYPQILDRQLAPGVRRHRADECGGRRHVALRAEADASQADEAVDAGRAGTAVARKWGRRVR